MKYTFGFIGCGNMGGALITALTKKVAGQTIAVCDHTPAKAEKYAALYGAKVTTAEDIAQNADFVVMGVKPQVMQNALGEISPLLCARERVTVVSMAAGLSMSAIRGFIGKDLPIIRIMPNTPVAVECRGERVYVLDRLKNNITVFEPTEYGALVRQAVLAYDLGNYSEAEQLWKQVLKRNANSTLAYNGIGKALAQENRYDEAMQYLRLSGDRYSYSRSFGKNRLELVRNYGVYAIGGIAVLAVAMAIFKRMRKE